MTDAADTDATYARRLLELCKLEREGKISDLASAPYNWEVFAPNCGSLGAVRVWFRYMVPNKGICMELKPGQTLEASKIIRALNSGFTVTEVTA